MFLFALFIIIILFCRAVVRSSISIPCAQSGRSMIWFCVSSNACIHFPRVSIKFLLFWFLFILFSSLLVYMFSRWVKSGVTVKFLRWWHNCKLKAQILFMKGFTQGSWIKKLSTPTPILGVLTYWHLFFEILFYRKLTQNLSCIKIYHSFNIISRPNLFEGVQ